MVRRFFRSIAITAVLVALLTALLAGGTMYLAHERGIRKELRREVEYLCLALEAAGEDPECLAAAADGNRITLVAADGTVIFDSFADAMRLENHASRPEIAQAMAEGWGESARTSETLSERTLYCARRTAGGNVLRIACTQRSAFAELAGAAPLIAGILLCVVLVSLPIARGAAKKIVAPINGLDLERPLENNTYGELSPLLVRMEKQRVQLDEHVRELESTHTELKAILDNMREGMILLDEGERVLSVNGSAREIFGLAGDDFSGQNLLSVCRDAELHALAQSALSGIGGSMETVRGERHYRISASPVPSGGAVLMILDVTESFAAEESRREFTANVSHELKTPLTSISGFAEIIRDGIAQPQDVPRFAEMILKESARLAALVNDILELSKLDERQNLGQWERVDLKRMLEELVQDFMPAAERKAQRLSLSAESAEIEGYPMLLREMFFNLIDNAVKYTPNGGAISVSVRMENGAAICAVADTGIGIPIEHQPRVFERFYRVDRSHSRATGGTGLGLAIVKHVAQIHHAQVNLESAVGKGTTVSVKFAGEKTERTRA